MTDTEIGDWVERVKPRIYWAESVPRCSLFWMGSKLDLQVVDGETLRDCVEKANARPR
ncbi:MAG: hypothetical protein ABUJ92_00135 [Desulfobacterales bacterium]